MRRPTLEFVLRRQTRVPSIPEDLLQQYRGRLERSPAVRCGRWHLDARVSRRVIPSGEPSLRSANHDRGRPSLSIRTKPSSAIFLTACWIPTSGFSPNPMLSVASVGTAAVQCRAPHTPPCNQQGGYRRDVGRHVERRAERVSKSITGWRGLPLGQGEIIDDTGHAITGFTLVAFLMTVIFIVISLSCRHVMRQRGDCRLKFCL